MFILNRYKGILLLVFLLVFTHILYSAYNISTSLAPDFSVFYWAADSLGRRQNIYQTPGLFTGFGYPPATALLFTPFLFFPYQAAQTVFTFFNVLLVFLAGLFFFNLTRTKFTLPLYLITITLIFLSFPFKFTLGMGQTNLLVLTALLVSFTLSTHKRFRLAGIVLGFTLILKPILALLLLFYLVKQPKVAAIAILVSLLLTLFTVLFFGWDLYSHYIFRIIPPLLNFSGREIYYNQGLTGLIARLYPGEAARLLTYLLVTVLFLTNALIFVLKKHTQLQQLSLILTTLVLVDSLSWQHHFVFLFLPFSLIFTRSLQEKNMPALFLVTFSLLLVSTNLKNPANPTSLAVILLNSHATLGALLLYLLQLKSTTSRSKVMNCSKINLT